MVNSIGTHFFEPGYVFKLSRVQFPFYLGIKFHVEMKKGQVKLLRKQMTCKICRQCTLALNL